MFFVEKVPRTVQGITSTTEKQPKANETGHHFPEADLVKALLADEPSPQNHLLCGTQFRKRGTKAE